MLQPIRIVIEQHSDGFVAYPLGMTGAVVGEGPDAQSALSDVRSAIRFHVETFGPKALGEHPVLDAFVVEDSVELG
ncbi:MAG: type II toxin-antitoxin system HicB family antitoxin [Anaerosomatales bacterium]